jgi:hypothetical protein
MRPGKFLALPFMTIYAESQFIVQKWARQVLQSPEQARNLTKLLIVYLDSLLDWHLTTHDVTSKWFAPGTMV